MYSDAELREVDAEEDAPDAEVTGRRFTRDVEAPVNDYVSRRRKPGTTS